MGALWRSGRERPTLTAGDPGDVNSAVGDGGPAIKRNNERYQQMLDEMRNLAIFADDAGFDVFATTPWDEQMRQIELLAEHIIPAFR